MTTHIFARNENKYQKNMQADHMQLERTLVTYTNHMDKYLKNMYISNYVLINCFLQVYLSA